ncbi:MAG: sortase [Herbinix sp.]|jgi:sortase A|nr:sortase [Herbinix sp.]
MSIKRFILQGIAIVLIIFGLSLTIKHVVVFSRGYFAQNNHAEVISNDLTEAKDANTKIQAAELVSKILDSTKEETALYSKRPTAGDRIGELYIPKLEATLPIYEGTSEEELEVGVGHFGASVLPGEEDNSVLAGHRDTVFRNLGEVGVGDSLIVRTTAGEFEYQVNKVRIVDKDDRTVIVPKPRATLTVSTCYPFSYVGSAPKRYVLVAYLVSETLVE